MTTISIQDLRAGSDLIFDEETYLNELTDEQLLTYKGGATPTVLATVVAFSASGAASYLVTRFVKSFF